MKFTRLPLDKFIEIYHQVPRAAVDVIVVTNKGILLTKRSIPPFLGMWHIPGGTIMFKEPLQHAIERIAKEELSVEVKIIKQLGAIECLDDGGRHTIAIDFLTQIVNGTPQGSEQGKEIAYFKKVPKNIIPEQGKFLKQHLAEIKSYFE